MELFVLPDRLAICQLEKDAPLPNWATAGRFFAVVRTAEELSVVCPDGHPPPGVKTDSGWKALMVKGPLALEQTGVLAALANPLAEAEIPTFALSTYETDYLLIKEQHLSRAVRVLGSDHSIYT